MYSVDKLLTYRSCRAKLEEHNNRRRKRQAQDDALDRVEAKPTRSRRKAVATAHVTAVKAKRAPRRKKPNALVHLLPDDKPTSSSSVVRSVASLITGPAAFNIILCIPSTDNVVVILAAKCNFDPHACATYDKLAW